MSFSCLLLAITAANAALIPAPPVQVTSVRDVALTSILPAVSGLVLPALPTVPPPSATSNTPAVTELNLPTSLSTLQPAFVVVSSLFSNIFSKPSRFIQSALDIVSSVTDANVQASSGPQQLTISTRSSIVNLALPSSSKLVRPGVSSAPGVISQTSPLSIALNTLSLASTSAPASFGLSKLALENVFNGLNVQFPSPSVSIAPVLASVTSHANLILPTATDLLQAAVTSIFPTSSSLLLPAAANALGNGTSILPASCVDVFVIASQRFGMSPTTLVTLQSACSPLSIYVSSALLSPGLVNTLTQPSPSLLESLNKQLEATAFEAKVSAALLAFPQVTRGSLPLPCTSTKLPSPTTCSLVSGNLVPRNGLLSCGTCPTNTGLLGVAMCPWLCSISSFGARIYSCSPIDITGQTFPDSSALNITNHHAEAVCHQCVAPCNTGPSPMKSLALATAAVPSATIMDSATTTTSSNLSCTNAPSSTAPPCWEPYCARGNLVCTSCQVDPAELAVCAWLCRMPYVEGRINLECSPIDLSGVSLCSSYNENVQSERCRPGGSSTSGPASVSTCVLSTRVAVPLTPTAPSILTPVTTVSTAAPICTNLSPDLPPVNCMGGSEFVTLFCPQGCPTVFTNQCTFLCKSTFGRESGGVFRAIQCAPVDLSLISPGTDSCRQCYPQCSSNSTKSSAGLQSGSSHSTNLRTARLTLNSISASLPTSIIVTPYAVNSSASQDNNTSPLSRSSCGLTAETVGQCPFICSAGGAAPYRNCSSGDMTGKLMYESYPPLVCLECLPPCRAATMASTGPLCSSIAPSAPDPSPLIDLSGNLYRKCCGTSTMTVRECPYLCGLLAGGLISRQCFHQDLTNKTTIKGVFANIGLLTCERCLPPCGKSNLPSCTSHLFREVTSLAAAFPSTVLALAGAIESLPAPFIANAISRLPVTVLPSLLNPILAQLPASVATPPILGSMVATPTTVAIPPFAISIVGTLENENNGDVPSRVTSVVAALPAFVAGLAAVRFTAAQVPSRAGLPASHAVINSTVAGSPISVALPLLTAPL